MTHYNILIQLTVLRICSLPLHYNFEFIKFFSCWFDFTSDGKYKKNVATSAMPEYWIQRLHMNSFKWIFLFIFNSVCFYCCCFKSQFVLCMWFVFSEFNERLSFFPSIFSAWSWRMSIISTYFSFFFLFLFYLSMSLLGIQFSYSGGEQVNIAFKLAMFSDGFLQKLRRSKTIERKRNNFISSPPHFFWLICCFHIKLLIKSFVEDSRIPILQLVTIRLDIMEILFFTTANIFIAS